MIIKYPPIEGGVSVQGYWLARGLADRGHQVLVVTNAREVEPSYCLSMNADDEALLQHDGGNGGWVRVRQTGDLPGRLSHIPRSPAFVTKLASVAAEECAALGGVELLFANYLEPYGVAASLVSQWTGIPYVIQMAGSDRTRLMGHPDLGFAYTEVLKAAAKIISADPALVHAGVHPQQLTERESAPLVPVTQFRTARPANLAEMVATNDSSNNIVRATRLTDRSIMTIGILGKVGEAKGTYDLLNALALVRQRGRLFSLVVMGAGPEMADVGALATQLGIADWVFEIPPQPHWRVASFLKACDLVCILERDFPVEIHRPRIVGEVLLAGTCALLSGEMATKQRFYSAMNDGENVVIVRDPKNWDDLAKRLTGVLDDPESAVRIGEAGSVIYRPDPADGVLDDYQQVFREAVALSRSQAKAVVLPTRTERGDDALSLFAKHLTASRQAIGDEFVDCLDEYLGSEAGRAHGCDPYLMEQWLVEHSPRIREDSTLRDLVALELMLAWGVIGSTSDPIREFPPYVGAFRHVPGADLSQKRPVASAWTRSRAFGYDTIRCRQEMISGGQVHMDEGQTRGYTVLVHRTRSLLPQARLVDARFVALLRECDGTRTRSTLKTELERSGMAPAHLIEQQLLIIARAGLLVHR